VDGFTTSNARASSRSFGHWVVLAACFVAPLGLLAMRLLLTPSPSGYGTHEQLGLPACMALDWFHTPCPGCGVTTSVTWFAHEHPWESLQTQPFGFALAAFALISAPLAILAVLRGLDLGEQARRFNRWSVWFPIGLFAAASWAYKAVVYWMS